MRLYFSGVAGQSEAAMLREAGVRHVLADPTDYSHARAAIDGVPAGQIALDCGAYRAYKKAKKRIAAAPFDLEAYAALVSAAAPVLAVAPDVIGDPEATRRAWIHLPPDVRALLSPVWHWGAPREHLDAYLDEAEAAGGLVCVGALVPPMRSRDATMLASLERLCSAHPGRLHLLGANWLAALERLAPCAASADTSKWLDGGRYGEVIFPDPLTGALRQLPDRNVPLPPGASGWDRGSRCVRSARALDRRLNG